MINLIPFLRCVNQDLNVGKNGGFGQTIIFPFIMITMFQLMGNISSDQALIDFTLENSEKYKISEAGRISMRRLILPHSKRTTRQIDSILRSYDDLDEFQ